jgi:hypothetical protein
VFHEEFQRVSKPIFHRVKGGKVFIMGMVFSGMLRFAARSEAWLTSLLSVDFDLDQ